MNSLVHWIRNEIEIQPRVLNLAWSCESSYNEASHWNSGIGGQMVQPFTQFDSKAGLLEALNHTKVYLAATWVSCIGTGSQFQQLCKKIFTCRYIISILIMWTDLQHSASLQTIYADIWRCNILLLLIAEVSNVNRVCHAHPIPWAISLVKLLINQGILTCGFTCFMKSISLITRSRNTARTTYVHK